MNCVQDPIKNKEQLFSHEHSQQFEEDLNLEESKLEDIEEVSENEDHFINVNNEVMNKN